MRMSLNSLRRDLAKAVDTSAFSMKLRFVTNATMPSSFSRSEAQRKNRVYMS